MKRVVVLAILIALGASADCVAQSTTVYSLVVPPSAVVAGSGCACGNSCGEPDSTWIPDGTYANQNDCLAAIPGAIITVIDDTGATSTNDCSQTAQCVAAVAAQ